MTVVHDPRKQIGFLQQCLSSDKKPLAFFLGAGCPVSITVDPGDRPLIPDIVGLTEEVRKRLSQGSDHDSNLKKIEDQLRADGKDRSTIEEVLSHIRGLRAVAGKASVRGFSRSHLDLLDQRICSVIHEVTDKCLPGPSTPYHCLAAWVDAVRRENPVEVFTTNYDLLMEQAFEDHGVPYFDGFAGVRRPFFDLRAMEEDMLPPRWARLWKIHGSVNWYQDQKGGVFRGSTEGASGARRVIHPTHLKYDQSRRLPYLAMIDRLRAFMKKPGATLVACGSSFSDEHLNEVILQGLEYSRTAAAFALIFGSLEEMPIVVDLAERCRNFSVLGRDGGVIGGRPGQWPIIEDTVEDSNDCDWISWEATDLESSTGSKSAVFRLGDFAVFGCFLAQLVGLTLDPIRGTRE